MNKISFLIAAYNEEVNIGKTLNSVIKETPIGVEAEIIVVTSGCTDRTNEIVKQYQEQTSSSFIRLLNEKHRNGKASALNLATANAMGDILILLDADVVLEHNSIQYLLQPFSDTSVGLVCSKVLLSCEKSKLCNQIAKSRSSMWDSIREKENTSGSLFIPSGYLYSIRKFLFPMLPNNIIDEDVYVGIMVSQSGYKIIYEPSAMVQTIFPQNILDIIRQRTRNHVGRLQISKLYCKHIARVNQLIALESLNQVRENFGTKSEMPAFMNLLLEFLARIFAKAIDLTNRTDFFYKWPQILSTKKVLIEGK